MAKRKVNTVELSHSTEIEVVITKGDKCMIKPMTYGEALRMKKCKGFRYQNFKVGYHNYKQNVE